MDGGRLDELLRRHKVDALVATSPENIRYAAGYSPFQGVWNRFPKALIHFADGSRQTLMLPIAEAGFLADVDAGARLDVTLFGVANLVFPKSELDLDAREHVIREWTAD